MRVTVDPRLCNACSMCAIVQVGTVTVIGQ